MHFIGKRNTSPTGKIEPNKFSPLNNVILIFQKAEGLELQAKAAGEEKGRPRPQDQVQHSTSQQN